jgi:hypothetical protein
MGSTGPGPPAGGQNPHRQHRRRSVWRPFPDPGIDELHQSRARPGGQNHTFSAPLGQGTPISPDAHIAAPMGATVVNRACESGPVTCVCRRAGRTIFRDLPRSCPVTSPCGRGPVGDAGSRAAARTNELDADERRQVIGSEEGSFRAGGGVAGVPGAWWAEWSRKHPFGVSSCSGAGRHDHVSGDRAAQSNDRARPGGGRLMPQRRACPGLGDPLPVGVHPGGQAAELVSGLAVAGVAAAWTASRW